MKLLHGDVDRRDWQTLGRDGFRSEYQLPLRPLIISGAIDGWAALGKWTPEFFKREHGSRVVIVDGQRWRLADLIDEMLSSTAAKPAPYLHNQLLARWPSELLADVSPMPECTAGNRLESRLIPRRQPLTFVELYIGGAGAKFPVVHYDYLHTHAFLMQLYGEKEYLALPPDQTPYVYPRDGLEANKSQIEDPEQPDLIRFPLFEQATGIRFRLHPGETLFVPAGWWHTVKILTPSITVSANGLSRANWSAFRRDYVADVGRQSQWKAIWLQSWLVMLGVAFNLTDYF